MIVLDALERIDVEVDSFRVITDEGSVRYSVEIVMPRDDILSVDLLCPPPQHGHAVLLGADRDTVGLPVLRERFHMFRVQGFCLQSAKAQSVKLDPRRATTFARGSAGWRSYHRDCCDRAASVDSSGFSSCVNALVSVSDHLEGRSRPSPESGLGLGTQLPFNLKTPDDRQHRLFP